MANVKDIIPIIDNKEKFNKMITDHVLDQYLDGLLKKEQMLWFLRQNQEA